MFKNKEKDQLYKYLELGVNNEKIIKNISPSICIYSISRKCLVGENGIEALEIIDSIDGINKELSYKNNRIVSLQIYSDLSQSLINEINNSSGIIITDAVYDKPNFRFGFIPTL